MGDTYLSFFIILHSIFLGLFMVDLSKKLHWDWISIRYFIDDFKNFCEAQGKGRAKGRRRKVIQRSFIDGGWWISFP